MLYNYLILFLFLVISFLNLKLIIPLFLTLIQFLSHLPLHCQPFLPYFLLKFLSVLQIIMLIIQYSLILSHPSPNLLSIFHNLPIHFLYHLYFHLSFLSLSLIVYFILQYLTCFLRNFPFLILMIFLPSSTSLCLFLSLLYFPLIAFLFVHSSYTSFLMIRFLLLFYC